MVRVFTRRRTLSLAVGVAISSTGCLFWGETEQERLAEELGRQLHQHENFTVKNRPVTTEEGYTGVRFEADMSAGKAKRIIAREFARVVAKGFQPVGFHFYGETRNTTIEGREIKNEWAEAWNNDTITMQEYTRRINNTTGYGTS